MPVHYIISLPRTDLHALSFQGLSIPESYQQIKKLVAGRLTASHVDLFSEPFQSNAGEAVDFYTELSGQLLPWSELSAEKQQIISAKLSILKKDINDLALELKKFPASQIAGNMLALALISPEPESIYASGDQPVLVGWGFEKSSAQIAGLQDLMRTAPKAVIPPVEPAKEQSHFLAFQKDLREPDILACLAAPDRIKSKEALI